MRTSNPFQMDPTWAKATENVRKIVEGNPEQEAALESALTEARSTQQADRFKRENRRLMGEAADAFGDQNYLRGLQRMMQTNQADILKQAPDLQLGAEGAFQAENVDPGDTQARLMALQGGAGLQPDENTSFTPEAQGAISARDAEEAQQEARITEWADARANAQNPTTMEGLGALRVRNGVDSFRGANLDLQAGQMSPDQVVGERMVQGDVGLQRGMDLTDNPSLDEVFARGVLDENITPERGSELRGWDDDSSGGSGGGGGVDSPAGALDILSDSQDVTPDFQAAAGNVFSEMGVPTDDDDNLKLDGQMGRIYSEVVNRAQNAAVQDAQRNGRPTMTSEEYIRRAVQDMNISYQPKQEGYLWDSPAEMTTGGGDNGSGGQMQRNQSAGGGSGPQPGMVEDGYVFLGGDPGDPENWQREDQGQQAQRGPGGMLLNDTNGWRGTTLQVPDA